MNRRTMIAGLAGLSLAGIEARAEAPQPYTVSLIGGTFDGQAWLAGVKVDLDKDWKTYWRMPGEAGIPPQFDWSASRGIGGVDVLYPLPGRLHDLSGETIGYERQVVFPVIVKPEAAATAAELRLNLFFAVCKDICIPAKAQATLALTSANASSADAALTQEWMGRVPVPGWAVRSLAVVMEGDKPVLVAKLLQPADDIFVESPGAAYFRKPAFSADDLEARLLVDNVKAASQLQGLILRLTVAAGGSGIEQSLTVE